jgi:hypothetical protein
MAHVVIEDFPFREDFVMFLCNFGIRHVNILVPILIVLRVEVISIALIFFVGHFNFIVFDIKQVVNKSSIVPRMKEYRIVVD